MLKFLSLGILALDLQLGYARYVLQDEYSPAQFLDMFDFFTGSDPTEGSVVYVDQTTSVRDNLVRVQNDSVYIGVDNTNIVNQGRPSVRLESKKTYNQGLVVLDLDHMPEGVCGTWPAFWSVGPLWPKYGEIDIIEGVNAQSHNVMALHTESDCTIAEDGSFSGIIKTTNCNVNAANQAKNTGCRIDAMDPASYGAGFNDQSGGVFVMQWTASAVKIWMFPRKSIPSDLGPATIPDPASWTMPMASFSGGCNMTELIQDQRLVFDVTFCGQWAGSDWAESTCTSLADTCDTYVRNNPTAFSETYWSIRSLKVFQEVVPGNGSQAVPSSLSPTSPTGLSAEPTVHPTAFGWNTNGCSFNLTEPNPAWRAHRGCS